MRKIKLEKAKAHFKKCKPGAVKSILPNLTTPFAAIAALSYVGMNDWLWRHQGAYLNKDRRGKNKRNIVMQEAYKS